MFNSKPLASFTTVPGQISLSFKYPLRSVGILSIKRCGQAEWHNFYMFVSHACLNELYSTSVTWRCDWKQSYSYL